ncbi:MAG: lipoprotein [Segetibacter sp.]|nr:lipoprotein [Segetibacter sp.]
MRRFLLSPFLLFLLFFSASDAQKKSAIKKYPSLFWEITGNGLKKPSYLFGTMHVSSKMVFHLSDSFYYAMRNTDAVALELNPEIWQDEMFRFQKAQMNLAHFSLGKMNDYLKESSFELDRYEDDIKRALIEEPTVVNNLLYRSYQSSADFEENTYLDLYIYQTGRKLGKQAAGVENYIESERLMMEAYQDMAKDKSKRRLDNDGESIYDIQKKIQQAYRNGDLDLMDSLQGITSNSTAFSEKFLYVRNDIQANSIDTIVKKRSLFVGVGAAHLPGPRGVIELLRKKGYKLRPIFMQDRDASQKEEIDKLKVPVVFRQETTQDGKIELQLPGKLYKREDARGNESWQYADMNNGSYYMLTRVRTHAAMLGHNEKVVLNKVDSMLYENIPGRIFKKTVINKNGYPGFDITNRTRRGDLQRYEILVTPYEVLVFKMSGNDNYVEGKEADSFFSSIKVKPVPGNKWFVFEPVQGGFKVNLPKTANEVYNKNTTDGTGRWEYESFDNSNANAYMVWKKSLYNFNFIEEDTFDIALIDESFKTSEIINKQLSRKVGVENEVRYLESKFSLKDGSYITTKAFIKGPHYYLLAARSKDRKTDFSKFFNSFQFTDYKYSTPGKYIDSTLKLEVVTSVRPNVDTVLRSWMEKAGSDAIFGSDHSYSGWPKNKTGIFKSDSTGESILVTVQNFPKYYYSRDSARFWRDKLDERETEKDLVFRKKEFFKVNDSACGYHVVLTDTNSSRCIKSTYYLKGNNLYKFSTLSDTTTPESEFVKTFFATATPIDKNPGPSVFNNKLDAFFADYASKDSAITKYANQAIPSIYFGKNGVQRIMEAINNLKYGDKDYFETKTKFITELGYMDDSSSHKKLVPYLKELYDKSADTSYFQNPVLSALARLQTKESYDLLKRLLVQDPPIFDDSYEYGRIFNQFSDTLPLAKTLFPEILQLASLEDYKPFVNSLLKSMVDSGYLSAADYDSYFSKLYFDAKIELKKQQNKDEKRLEMDDDDDDESENDEPGYKAAYTKNSRKLSTSSLEDYAVLLMPFYDKYPSVPKYFQKLLQSKDVDVQLIAARLMIEKNKKIPDSLFASIAARDRYRAKLYSMLKKINRVELFPSKYKSQEIIAKALLLNDKNYKEFASIQLVDKRVTQLKGTRGNVYLFKYKIKPDDDWKIGISGLQPLNTKEVSTTGDLIKLTDKKLKLYEDESEQFNEQIKRVLFAQHKSGRKFFERINSWGFSDNNFED